MRTMKKITAIIVTLMLAVGCMFIPGDKAAAADIIPYSAGTLPAGKVMLASTDSPATDFKIVPGSTGYIHVTLIGSENDNPSGYITLLDSNKRALSDRLLYYTNSSYNYVVFGVKKGTVYYLRTTGILGVYNQQHAYGIGYTLKSAPIRKNTKKSKALNLKRKAKAKVVAIPATNKKKTQWYKFKVTKKRKTQIRVDASAMKSGSASIIIYCGKKKVGSANMSLGDVHTYTITHSTTYGKANKGTYYVKVTTNAKSNGAYSVRYLK